MIIERNTTIGERKTIHNAKFLFYNLHFTFGWFAGNIDRICKAKPNAVIAMPSNCAKYYNCSANSIGHHLHECTYPDLFSVTINRCQPFENVACQNRSEPMAPCKCVVWIYLACVRIHIVFACGLEKYFWKLLCL